MDRILLLAAALLWGGTLSAQRISTQFLGAFSFMGVRYLVGFLSMLPIVYWEQRYHNNAIDGEKKPFSLVLAAAILAIFLTAGTGFQQLGMFYTTAGKAGFITSLYIVIVPFFAYFVGQPLRRTAIIGSLLAMIGMYFFQMQCWALVTDVIDDMEVKNHTRDDGTVYGMYSFARKIGQAIAGGLSGWALGWIGYDELATSQTQEVANGIYNLSTFFPAIIYALCGLALLLIYPLSKAKVEANVKELESRRK